MTAAEAKKLDAEIAQLIATSAKLNAETQKITTENRFYPMIVASTGTLAIVAIVKLFL